MDDLSIRYPTDTSTWLVWQREYRYGAFYLFPPIGLIEEIDQLRERYDPASHQICQAHVSLTEPLPGPLSLTELTELEDRIAAIQPFIVRFGDVHATTSYPGVVYRIEPADRFLALRAAMHSASVFQESSLGRKDVPPHMTIAQFVSLEESQVLAQQLHGLVREGEWLTTEIEYAAPDESFRFRRIFKFQLGSGAIQNGTE